MIVGGPLLRFVRFVDSAWMYLRDSPPFFVWFVFKVTWEFCPGDTIRTIRIVGHCRVLEVVGDSDEILGEAVTSADLLYETASAVDWSRYMRHDQTLSVDAILGVVPDGLTHSHFTALTVKVSERGRGVAFIRSFHDEYP